MLKYTIQDRVLPIAWDIMIVDGFAEIFESSDPAQPELNVEDEFVEGVFWTIYIENAVIKIETSALTTNDVTLLDEPSTNKQYRLGVINGFLRAPQTIVISTDIISFQSASSSSVSSSSSSKSWAAVAWGEQNPVTEKPVSWQVWRRVDDGLPVLIGDVDWGRVALQVGEQILSDVQFMGDPGMLRTFTLLSNKYGFGSGSNVVSIRGSDTPFDLHDPTPAWEPYTLPIVRTWSYVQARLEGA